MTTDALDDPLIWSIINSGARAYQGFIPADSWHDPYMSRDELRTEMNDGGAFYADPACLYPHGQPEERHRRALARGPILIGTWADAAWAIRF